MGFADKSIVVADRSLIGVSQQVLVVEHALVIEPVIEVPQFQVVLRAQNLIASSCVLDEVLADWLEELEGSVSTADGWEVLKQGKRRGVVVGRSDLASKGRSGWGARVRRQRLWVLNGCRGG